MPRLQLNLYLELEDGRPWAPEGPGWYLDVRKNASSADNHPGYQITPRVRLSPVEAAQIAQVLDRFVVGKALNWDSPTSEREEITMYNAVIEANEDGQAALIAALAAAEAAVTRITELRRRVGEFNEPG